MNNADHNMIKLFKLFKKHPHMFLHFLKKNNAFSDAFINKLSNVSIPDKPIFVHINDMHAYYSNLLNINSDVKISEDEWNDKLRKAIYEQRFEDAAAIRDQMFNNNIKIDI